MWNDAQHYHIDAKDKEGRQKLDSYAQRSNEQMFRDSIDTSNLRLYGIARGVDMLKRNPSEIEAISRLPVKIGLTVHLEKLRMMMYFKFDASMLPCLLAWPTPLREPLGNLSYS
jgi:hypothetical protein